MEINRNYMKIIMHKMLEDIKAKELDYGINGVKVQILLGRDEAQVLLDALDDTTINEAVEKTVKDIKQNYIPKDVLDKIREEIEEIPKKYPMTMDYESGLKEALAIIDKYKAESEKSTWQI